MKKSKYLIIIAFFIIVSFFSVLVIDKHNQKHLIDENTVDKREESADNVAVTVRFDGIGHYGFANAGSNNAYRGSDPSGSGRSLIVQPPTDSWYSSIRTSVSNSGYSINNITGSRLNTSGGVVKKAYLSYFAMSSHPNYSTTGEVFNGKILLINPNGQYHIITPSHNGSKGLIDITSYINTNSPDGWYYVSFLKGYNEPQLAWSITTVYERSNLPLRYIRLMSTSKGLHDGLAGDIAFNSKFALNDNYQLMGVILAGGKQAWSTDVSSTGDKAWAILSNGSTKQLYQNSYEGRTIFKGRSNVDFANGTFTTQKNHNYAGGELDIFDETLSKDFFNNQSITGLRFQKTGDNTIILFLFGIAQEVKVPGVNITTKITPANNPFRANNTVTVTTTITGSKVNNECLTAYNNVVTTSVDSVLSNPTNIVVKKGNTSYSGSYANGQITSSEIPSLTCTDTITVTYNATINSSINNRISNHSYYINNNAKISYSLINLNNLSGSELNQYRGYLLSKNATHSVTSPTPATLVVKYIDQDGNNIDTSQNINDTSRYYGQSYTTTQKTFANYDFDKVQAGSDPASGTISKDTINVTYVYRRKATLTVNYYTIDSHDGNGTLVHRTTSNLHYNDNYTTNGTTEGYNNDYYYFDHVVDENNLSVNNYSVSGIVRKDNIVVEYYYKIRTGDLTVYHYKEGTTDNIDEPEITEGIEYGTTYNTKSSEDLDEPNYIFSKTDTESDAVNGIIEKEHTVVIYYYHQRDSVAGTKISKTGPEKLTSPLDKAHYEITFHAEVKDYEGMATIKLIDLLPYEINEENSELDGGVYNSENKTITWEMLWDDIFVEGDEVATKDITKNIVLQYKGIVGRDRLINNKVNSTLILGSNEALNYAEDNSDTDIEVKGKIIVHHYLVNSTNKLFDDGESENLVGESYVSNAKEKEGYYLVEKPKNENLAYEEELQEVIYYYDIYRYKITTKAINEGGTIKGNETVDYGANSTENNIVINPKKGYIIRTIKVNGEKIDVTNNKGMTLENFKEVKEDKLVEVEFVVADNPKTTKESINFLFGLLAFLAVLLFLIRFIIKDNFIKL